MALRDVSTVRARRASLHTSGAVRTREHGDGVTDLTACRMLGSLTRFTIMPEKLPLKLGVSVCLPTRNRCCTRMRGCFQDTASGANVSEEVKQEVKFSVRVSNHHATETNGGVEV
jgi:hypothetical protein